MVLQLLLVSIIAVSVSVVSGQSFISPNINETTPVEIFPPLPDDLTGNFAQIPEDELNTPEFLRLAAKTDERIIVRITGPFTPVVAQNGVNINFDCLPWLMNFPGGVITWMGLTFIRSPDTGLFVATGPSEEVDRTTEMEVQNGASPIVGGEFNRWLNITRTNIIQGAQDINQGNYTCEVCIGTGFLPEPICHTAVSTLLLIGGPPIITQKGTGVTAPRSPPNIPGSFNVGDNFCFQRDSIDSFSVQCPTDLTIEPTPIRNWTKDGGLVYSEVVGQTPTFDPEFLQGRNQIFSANTNPIVLSIANTEGLLMFQTGLFLGGTMIPFINFTNVMVPGFPNPTRDGVLELLKGEWACSVENSFGSDTAATMIRECGEGPVLGICVDPSFLQNGQSIPVGCVVCIPRGASITLDCTAVSGDPPITYEWTDSSGVIISDSPKLIVSREDSFTCVAQNPDNPVVSTTSTLIFSPSLDFGVDVIDRFGEIRRESGCERLRTELASPPDVCVFVGETLNFTCTQSISGEPLNVTFNGNIVQGPIVVTADMADAISTDYSCSLNTEGPCGQASTVISVRVFEPARVNRRTNVSPSFGAGQSNAILMVTEGAPVTLACPTTGINDPSTNWTLIRTDRDGVPVEVPADTIFDVSVSGDSSNLMLAITDFNSTVHDGTYVCRTSNVAGQDAAIVALSSRPDGGVWAVGPFSECNANCRDGIKVRGVTCVSRLDGRVVLESQCPDDRPPSQALCIEFSRSCNLNPIFVVGGYGPCSLGCKGGFRTRDVTCVVPATGEIRKDSDCFGMIKPRETINCPNICCSSDTFSACRQIGPRFCNMISYQQQCCWTCLLREIP